MKKLHYVLLLLPSLAVILTAPGVTDHSPEVEKAAGYDYLEQQLSNAKTYTLEVIEGFPEEEFSFKPGEEMRTFGAQAFHIAYSLEWFNAQLKGTPIAWDPGDEDRMTKEELIDYTTEQFDVFIATINSAEESGPFTAGVLSTLRHNSHHRGQMVAYYRANGIAPPSYK